MMGSSVHLHVIIDGVDYVVVIDISNMTFDEVKKLSSGATIKLVFGGNNCHIFGMETGENLEGYIGTKA